MLTIFKRLLKGTPDWHETINDNFEAMGSMPIDGGLFTGDVTDDPSASLEEHETDPQAHPNLQIQGGEF